MLSILFNYYGREEYANVMYDKILNNDNFYYTEEEYSIINEKIDEYNRVLKEYTDEMVCLVDSFGDRYGVLFSDYQYRNEFPEYIINVGNPWTIKYVVIVALDKGEYGQKSYRRIDDNVDCNRIAMLHGGGGHVGSAAVSINEIQNKKIKKMEKKKALEFIANSSYEVE